LRFFFLDPHPHFFDPDPQHWYRHSTIFRDPWVPLAVFDKFNKIKEMLSELGDSDVEKHIIKALEVIILLSYNLLTV
jgi:hypothetical protein